MKQIRLSSLHNMKWEPYMVDQWVYDDALVTRYYKDSRYPFIKRITSNRSLKTGRYYGTDTRKKHYVIYYIEHFPEIWSEKFPYVALQYQRVGYKIANPEC